MFPDGRSAGSRRAIAPELARAGMDIALNDIAPGAPASDAAEIAAIGGRASFYQADVADRAAVETMVEHVVAEYGRLDILVNNAGMQVWEPFLEITDDPLERILAVDLKGVILCSQVAARQMVRQGHGGRIVNISSVHAVYSIKTAAVYDAAKAGVVRYPHDGA